MAQLPTLANPSPQVEQQAPAVNLGAIQAQIIQAQRQQELAQKLMEAGYIPNSGALGALAQVFSAWRGKKLDRKSGETVKEAVARKFEEESRIKAEQAALQTQAEEAKYQRNRRDTVEDRNFNAEHRAGTPFMGADNRMYSVTGTTARPIQVAGAAPAAGNMEAILAQANAAIKAGVPPEQVEAWIGQQQGVSAPEQQGVPLMGQPKPGPAPAEFERKAAYLRAQGVPEAQITALVMGEKPESPQAAAKRQATEQKTRAQAAKAKAALTTTEATIDDTIKEAEAVQNSGALGGVTGMGGMLSSIPGTDWADTKARLTTLMARSAFGTLQEMRNNSPTGGALGSVSERELDLLQNAATALSTAQSPEALKQSLGRYIQVLKGSKSRLRTAYSETFSDDTAPVQAQPPANDGWSIQAVP
jgi:hypothetical protein